MIIQNFSYMKIPQYIQQILDEITTHNREYIIVERLLMIAFFTATMAISLYLMRKLIIGVSRKIEYSLRETLYHKLLSLDYLFYQKNQTGDLISRCSNDISSVRVLLGPGVMYIPNSLSRLFMFLPILISLSGKLMLYIGLIMMILIMAILKLLPLLRPLYEEIQIQMGVMNNSVWQVISGISSIKQFTAEEPEISRFEDLNKKYIKTQMAAVKLQELLRPLFVYLFSATELIVLLVGGKQVINGQMTLGELLRFNIMIANLAFPILALGWMMSLIQQGISSMKRINYILDHPSQDYQARQPFQAESPVIEVKKLTYRYPGHDNVVLDNIDMKIEPGHIIGITGPVGCGKSTLINIINGLLPPERGQVFIDGTDICDLNMEDYYKHVAVVSQDPFLFSRTIAENIKLGPTDLPEETIHKAAENAGLTSEIQSFQDGFSQMIGERGITLSGGQKQRTAIARALSKCTPLLIMDDPLSSVDSRTEEHILNSLNEHNCYRTLVLVSHRISVLKTAHTIYVMDNGKIVEKGNHGGLIAKGGLYSKLARLQQMEMELEE